MRAERSVLRSYVPALALAVIGACGSSGAGEHQAPETPAGLGSAPPASAPRADPSPSAARQEALTSGLIAEVAERTVPSVVNVASTRIARERGPHGSLDDPFFRFFFGPGSPVPPERRQQSLGSGVIVGRDTVVTNNHVIEGADEVLVTTFDRRELKAKIVGTDPASDLAVLRLVDPPSGLQPIQYGSSDDLRLGEVVLAIGNPFGVGQTVTMGIVSAKGRANVGIVDYEDFIQTDAAINPGNSGGALVNLKGQLVGINTAILSRTGGSMGIGFAIPASMAQSIVDQLIATGEVKRGFIGVMIQDLTPALADALGVPDARGVLVSDVVEGGPAGKAGIKPRDIIVAVDGDRVESAGKLRNLIAARGVDATIRIELLSEGKKRHVEVELEQKQLERRAEGRLERSEGALGGLGLENLTPEFRERLALSPRVKGVLVRSVAPGSSAADAGLAPGDVIQEVNRNPVESVDELLETYERSGERVLIRVHRQGHSLYILLRK